MGEFKHLQYDCTVETQKLGTFIIETIRLKMPNRHREIKA